MKKTRKCSKTSSAGIGDNMVDYPITFKHEPVIGADELKALKAKWKQAAPKQADIIIRVPKCAYRTPETLRAWLYKRFHITAYMGKLYEWDMAYDPENPQATYEDEQSEWTGSMCYNDDLRSRMGFLWGDEDYFDGRLEFVSLPEYYAKYYPDEWRALVNLIVDVDPETIREGEGAERAMA